jgi:uncharacterized membrane protein (UPF0136 family)
MNKLNETFWGWFLFVVVVGGMLGYYRRSNHAATVKERIVGLIIGIATSMFTAYLVFEAAYGYIGNEHISIALAGLAAWMGADALCALQKAVISYINRKGE